MTPRGVSVVLLYWERQHPTGLGARAVADIRRSGRKEPTKGLTHTERRLSFAFAEGTPRPEGQVLRLTARGY